MEGRDLPGLRSPKRARLSRLDLLLLPPRSAAAVGGDNPTTTRRAREASQAREVERGRRGPRKGQVAAQSSRIVRWRASPTAGRGRQKRVMNNPSKPRQLWLAGVRCFCLP
jgi:hypothetical protein